MHPLVDAIRRHVTAGATLHADDAPVPVLTAGNGQTKTGRLWTDVRDDRPSASCAPPAVWSVDTPDRNGIHPQTHLANFAGILQADAYAGFNLVYESGPVQEAALWTHTRRECQDLHVTHATATTTEALPRLSEAYDSGNQIRGKQPDICRQICSQQALPQLSGFQAWLRARLPTLSAKPDTRRAINYALNQWQALRLYCHDGVADIDNNAAERALRSVALGTKNFASMGADGSGERTAAMTRCSTTKTCSISWVK